MTFNEYSSFMNDKLHLFENHSADQRSVDIMRKVFDLAFGNEADNKWKDFSNTYGSLSNNKMKGFLKKAGISNNKITALINEAKTSENNKDPKEDQQENQLTEEQKQLKANYEAAKKAYKDKVEAIKKGIDIDTIGSRITTLADNATKLNMPAEKVQQIKKNAGEFRRTAGMVLEGIGAILSVFPGLEGVAQIAGGLGAVSTKYGNKAAEEAAKEAENFDKNKQVLSQAGINSREEYETALNNIAAQGLNSLPKYLERAVKNNRAIEIETAQNELITGLNTKTESYYSSASTFNNVSPDNISKEELDNIMSQLGITDQNQQNTYKRNLKWREDPNYDGDPKYKIDLSAKKYLSNLINAKDFNTINKLKGDNSTGANNGNQ